MKDEEKGAIPSEVVEKSSTLHTASFTPHPRGSGLSEENQIEEMVTIMCNVCAKQDYPKCDDRGGCICEELAETYYNVGYRKQSEWISVDERLPKDCVRVLVYGETDIFIATRLNGGWFAPVHCDGEITHWMPLPEPPKKGGAE